MVTAAVQKRTIHGRTVTAAWHHTPGTRTGHWHWRIYTPTGEWAYAGNSRTVDDAWADAATWLEGQQEKEAA